MAAGSIATDTVEAFLDNEDSPTIDNPIHSTAVARQYGFRGPIVAGVVVWGWSVPAVLAALGAAWLDRGWATVRFRQPTYPGDRLAVGVAAAEAGAFDLRMTNQDGVDCVVSQLGLSDAPWLGELTRPATPLAASTPVPAPLALADAPVGRDWAAQREMVVPAAAARFVRQRLRREDARFTSARPRLHPAWIADRCEAIMRHNHTLPHSIHTESRVQLLAPAAAGQAVTTGARVVTAYERKGHHLIVFDALIVGEDGRELAQIRHTTIFRIAPP